MKLLVILMLLSLLIWIFINLYLSAGRGVSVGGDRKARARPWADRVRGPALLGRLV